MRRRSAGNIVCTGKEIRIRDSVCLPFIKGQEGQEMGLAYVRFLWCRYTREASCCERGVATASVEKHCME